MKLLGVIMAVLIFIWIFPLQEEKSISSDLRWSQYRAASFWIQKTFDSRLESSFFTAPLQAESIGERMVDFIRKILTENSKPIDESLVRDDV